MKVKHVFILVLLASLFALGGCLFTSGPRAEFSADPQFAFPPLTVHFDASASQSPNGNITSYMWDFKDGETDTGVNVTHTFYEKGVYPVTLTVTDSTGAAGAITHNVEALNRAPHAEFGVWPHIPQRLTVTDFDASGSYDEDGYIVEWLWSFGDGATSSGDVVKHTYELAGSYTVRLTVIDDNGKSGFLTKIIRIGGCNTCG
jgi:cellulose 1,4-beta-cellobiosidase